MAPSKYRLILRHPIQFTIFLYAFVVRVLVILAPRLLLPAYPKYQSLRTEIERAFLVSASLHFSYFTYSGSPSDYSIRDARPLAPPDGTWKAFVIPGHDAAALETAVGKKNSRVVLYAHGGGYAFGHARQYVPNMKRWAQAACVRGIDLIFVSVEYSTPPVFPFFQQRIGRVGLTKSDFLALSGKATHPKQRDEFIAVYQHLLKLGIPSSRIIFMGDSAGGGVCVNATLHLPTLALSGPSCSILISPWLDYAQTSFHTTAGNPAVATDYLIGVNTAVPKLVKTFLGGKFSPMDSGVNPLYRSAADISTIPPQLLLVGGAEFALYDSEEWSKKCTDASVKCELVVGAGQLHIWAVGSWWLERRLRDKTDRLIVNWIEGRF